MSGEPDPPSTAPQKPSKAVSNVGTTSKRLRRDVETLCSDPPAGILAVPEHSDLRKVHALIIGAKDTPYQGGFFYFLLECPSNYPFKPPTVKLMTTDGGKVRFNPNLYQDGTVCMSILGTWDWPQWSPVQTLACCLISIQSIMNEMPYHNEPGFFKERVAGDAKRYNEVIRHETLRVAVCGMLEGETGLNVPSTFQDAMVAHFLEQRDYFVAVATKGLEMDGEDLRDPFNCNRGKFQYGNIILRLQALERNSINTK